MAALFITCMGHGNSGSDIVSSRLSYLQLKTLRVFFGSFGNLTLSKNHLPSFLLLKLKPLLDMYCDHNELPQFISLNSFAIFSVVST